MAKFSSTETKHLNSTFKEGEGRSMEICLATNTNALVLGECREKRACAVHIKNVCKSYNKETPILQNFCMNVKKGEIHSLLGSSGCGKTTILSCIVGLETWEAGEVFVFGEELGYKGCTLRHKKIGYMPQDLALYKELTIREIVQFFGQIYNMTNTEISDMWNFLSQLLNLPIKSTLIGNLSGGEKRRASLALAMVHSPDLLVLDEPTVGIDPLLRRNIWEHLYKLVRSSGTTVLITTHYIEEARLSDTIGVMRNGYMLVEDTPSNILSTYNCHLLEDAVIHLCRKDDRKIGILPAKDSSPPYHPMKHKYSSSWNKKIASYNLTREGTRESRQSKIAGIRFFTQKVEFNDEARESGDIRSHGFERKSSYSGSKIEKALTGSINNCFVNPTQRIRGLTKVKLITFIRNPLYFGTILFLPTIQAILSLITLGSKPTGLHLGIVNNELRNWSKECLLSSHLKTSCDLSFLTCKYLNHLENGDLLKLVSFNSSEQARTQVDLGKSWGYVAIPDNFSENSVQLATSKLFALNESIIGSRIIVHLDHSAYIQASLITKHLILTYMEFVQNISKSCDFDGQLGVIPLHFRPPVYGTYDDDFKGFVVPGVMALSLLITSIIITSVSHVSERCEGTLTRATSAGLTTIDIICSHLATQAIVAVIQLIIWISVLHFVFHFPILGSPWLLMLFGFLVEMFGAVMGLLLGQVFQNETQVLLGCIFVYPFILFFGCMFLPVNLMNQFWQHLAYVVPTHLPTESMRSIVIRGVGISHATVWLGLVSTLVWIGILLIFVIISFTPMPKQCAPMLRQF